MKTTGEKRVANSFRRFLMDRRADQNAIGDLARDALADPEWKGKRSAGSLRRRLEESGCCPGALAAFERAKALYYQTRTCRDWKCT